MNGKRFCGFLARTTIALIAAYLFCKPLLPAYNRILTAFVNPVVNCCIAHPDKVSISAGAADIYVETLNVGETSPRRFVLDNRPALFPLVFLSALFLSGYGMPASKRLKHILAGTVCVFLFQLFSVGIQVAALFAAQFGDFSVLHYDDFRRATFVLVKNFNHSIGSYAVPILYSAAAGLRFWESPVRGETARNLSFLPSGVAGK